MTLVLGVFYFIDPASGRLFSCPLNELTGLLCPGCGSQRALHALLHGEPFAAMHHNPLTSIGIPALGIQLVLNRAWSGKAWPELPKWSVISWMIVIGGWGILRNMPVFSGLGS
ncbi:MAG: DUF2752 domain-containing protein [Flavobacteriales bacterium]|nr:DUF2752 domain-containing protein [Flavobacteriales bacterium]